jgi:guanylate kinase
MANPRGQTARVNVTPPAGRIFVLVGPGGVGKNTLMHAMIARDERLRQLATVTTRPPRDNETNGVHHIFVSQERFHQMLADDDLLEHQEVTPGKFYGIPRSLLKDAFDAGQSLLADIDVFGAQALRQAFPQNTTLIFITVPGETDAERLATIHNRMRERADPHTDIAERLERAREIEFPFAAHCDHIIVNGELDAAARDLQMVIERYLGKTETARGKTTVVTGV